MKITTLKKFPLVFIMLVFLVQNLTLSIFAEELTNDGEPHKKAFSDINMYEEEINQLVELGIIQGFPDNTFRPDNPITRLQAVTMIIRQMKLDTTNRPDPHFKDVGPRQQGFDMIATVADEGIIGGKEDGSFDPEGILTRAQMAKIMANAYKLKLRENNNANFKDVLHTHWAFDYIKRLASNKISTGYTDGTFQPEAHLTRMHFTLFLSRYINQVEKEQPASTDKKDGVDQKADETKSSEGTSGGSSGGTSGGSPNDGNSGTPTPLPQQPNKATVLLSKELYTSGEEVVVQGVLLDEKGRPIANKQMELDGMDTVTDGQGNYSFKFLAIDENKEYRLSAGNATLMIVHSNGSTVETFTIPIDTETIDLKPTVIGLTSEVTEELIGFANGEKAVFKGKPKGIEKLSIGSVFVSSPTEEFPLGITGKVVSVQYENNNTIIHLTEPELEEIFDKLELEGSIGLSLENIIPDEGVEVSLINNNPDELAFKTAEVYLGDDVAFFFGKDILDVEGDWYHNANGIEGKFKGDAKLYLGGSLALKKTEVEYDFSLLKGLTRLVLRNEQDLTIGLTGKFSGEGEVSVRLGRIFIPIQAPLGIMGSLWVVVGADGEVTLKVGYDQTSELELGVEATLLGIKPIGGFKVTKYGFTKEVEGEAAIKSGFKPNLFLSVYTTEYIGLDNQFGIKGKVQGKVENIGTEDQRSCLATDIFLYAEFRGAIKKPIQKDLLLLTLERSLDKKETCIETDEPINPNDPTQPGNPGDPNPNPEQPDDGDEVVIFKDKLFEQEIRRNLNIPTRDITKKDMRELTSLSISSVPIKNISGIEHADNLSSLKIVNAQISDISALSTLSKLDFLSLHENQISDLTALSHLTNLKTLDLALNKISDISPLSNLVKLDNLSLNINQIRNIEPLYALKNLSVLGVSSNKISSISGINVLGNLKTLGLDSNQIQDISPLTNMIKLEDISLTENQITDIDALRGLTNLISLNLAANNISNIDALRNLRYLEHLNLIKNKVNDITILKNLTKLQRLSLGANPITSIDALANLTNLTLLHLKDTLITDISSLGNLINLEYLNILGTLVTDLSVLSKLPKLKILEY